MKKDPKATAHALAAIAGGYYILCLVFLAIAPDFFMGIYSSWFHGVNITQLKTGTLPETGTLIWGLITFTGFAWVTGYLFALVYNYFLKNK